MIGAIHCSYWIQGTWPWWWQHDKGLLAWFFHDVDVKQVLLNCPSTLLELWMRAIGSLLQCQTNWAKRILVLRSHIGSSDWLSVFPPPAFHLCGPRFESLLKPEPCMWIGVSVPTQLCGFSSIRGFPPTSKTEHFFTFPIHPCYWRLPCWMYIELYNFTCMLTCAHFLGRAYHRLAALTSPCKVHVYNNNNNNEVLYSAGLRQCRRSWRLLQKFCTLVSWAPSALLVISNSIII